MTLGELIAGMDENKSCTVLDTKTGEELARYDGKNSILEELNNSEVTDWFGFDKMYLVMIRR